MAEILERVSDQVYTLDRDWNITYLNTSAESFVGRPRRELLGRRLWELFPQLDPEVRRQYECAMADRAATSFEVESALKPGHWLAVHAYPSPDGLTVHCQDITATKASDHQVFARNITERRRAEARVRDTSRTLGALVTALPAAIYALDPDGCVALWNPAAERIFGWTADEVLGQPLPTIPPDKHDEHRTLLRRAFEGEVITGLVCRRVRKDGGVVHVSLSAAPTYQNGALARVVVASLDLTDRKTTEAALRESELRFEQLADNIPQVFWLAAADTKRTIYVSRAVRLV